MIQSLKFRLLFAHSSLCFSNILCVSRHEIRKILRFLNQFQSQLIDVQKMFEIWTLSSYTKLNDFYEILMDNVVHETEETFFHRESFFCCNITFDSKIVVINIFNTDFLLLSWLVKNDSENSPTMTTTIYNNNNQPTKRCYMICKIFHKSLDTYQISLQWKFIFIWASISAIFSRRWFNNWNCLCFTFSNICVFLLFWFRHEKVRRWRWRYFLSCLKANQIFFRLKWKSRFLRFNKNLEK